MSKSIFSRSNSDSKPRSRRRPTGVSRRQKRQNLGFETLEDRRVMSADYLLVPLGAETQLIGPAPLSYASSGAAGQAQLLQDEIMRYALIEANNGAAVLEPRSLPSDDLFGNQWYLLNVGQEVGNPVLQDIYGTPGEDINYFGARQLGYTGAGVTVAVIDSGVQRDHADLNIHPTLQFDGIDYDGDANPILPVFDPDFAFTYDPLAAHGTSVAGIIAALENGVGTVGIAPDSQIVPVRIIDAGQTTQGFVDSFQYAINNADITNNSWGPADGLRALAGPSPAELYALQSSVFGPNAGRNGLGTIHVFAAGNASDIGGGGGVGLDSASYDGYVNSRYTIGVTAVDHDGEYNNIDGTVTAFAESGASVLVAAPVGSFAKTIGDDFFIGTGVTTTDTTGSTGFNVPALSNGLEVDGDFLDPEDDAYTYLFGGTSSAAPQVAGVIALMLEANPNLGWRDVQDILVRSARQNAPTATQADGLDKATGIAYQQTWITNQVPLFHEPDIFDAQIDNAIQFYNPVINPLINLATGDISTNAHYAPSPQVLTNGAGFTVSQGRGTNNDQVGYAHGVIDAELAIRLAEQWSSKEQTLADELSFTTVINNAVPAGGVNTSVPAAHVVNPGGVGLIIPGGLGAGNNWQGYYDEYFVANPDFTQFPGATRGAPLELTVPQIDGQDIVVENVEVVLNIGGAALPTSEALDHLRITLVSPNGTHSELNHYFVDESFGVNDIHQTNIDFNPITGQSYLAPNGLNGVGDERVDRLSPTPINGNNLVFTFSSNRIWGERSDDAIIYNPLTNEPYRTLPGDGGNMFGGFGIESSVGDLVSQGWQLHFENYGNVDLNVNSLEVVWHGSPVGAATERVSGFVGLDEDQSDTFNYSRVITKTAQSATDFTDIDGDPNTLRLGEVQNLVDLNPEAFAANVTVFAYLDGNDNGIVDGSDILVDQFVTGHDGNFFFDLVPDNYLITTDDPRAFDDELTPDGLLPEYQITWQITEDFFTVWDYDANLNVPTTIVDGVETPSAYLDGNNVEVVTGVRNVNFLLNPGPEAIDEVNFSGVLFADLNGDGIFNGSDTYTPNIGVFADTNRNGQFDSGETLVETGPDGQYQFTLQSDNIAVIDVGVITPIDWQVISPGTGADSYLHNGVSSSLTLDPENSTYTFFTQPGDVISGVDFAVQPPASSTGGGGTSPTGTLLGTVFNDANADATRQEDELGVAGVVVYIDSNSSNSYDPGELTTVTNVNGAFLFSEVAAGEHIIRLDGLGDPLTQTSPINNFPNTVILSASGTISNIVFGISNSAVLDFGDLPAAYGITTAQENGARSQVGPYFLGARIDAETNGVPSVGAVGDDNSFSSDEDGVIVAPLTAGSQATNAQGQLTATASRFGGFLQGWIDFNGDFDFDDPGEQVVTNYGLAFGQNVISFDLPDHIEDTAIYARFRYGAYNMGLTGEDSIGEVEDYQLDVFPDPNPLSISGDFDEDGDVDGSDFLAWQRGEGMLVGASRSDGDADNNASVNHADLLIWEQEYGQSSAPLAAAVGGSSEDAGDQLAAALISDGLSSSTLSVPASYSDSSPSLNLPRIYQPGFREDLISGVVDTHEVNASVAGLYLSLADSGVQETLPASKDTKILEELAGTRSTERVLSVQDQAFTAKQDRLDKKRSQDTNEADEFEAIAEAFADETNWLFG